MLKLVLLLASLHNSDTVVLGTFPTPCVPVRRDFKLYYPCTGQEAKNDGSTTNDDGYRDAFYRTANEAGFYDWLFLNLNMFARDSSSPRPSYGYNPNLSELRIYRTTSDFIRE